jgi:hypothetical protein
MTTPKSIHDSEIADLMSAFIDIDHYTSVVYLEVPKNAVVLLQVFFELYDGVAAVRTVQPTKEESLKLKGAATGGVVCILTTPGQKSACAGLLNSLRTRAPWRVTARELDPFITNAQLLGV